MNVWLPVIAALVTSVTAADAFGDSLRWKTAWPWDDSRSARPALGANLGWQPTRYGSDLTGRLDTHYWADRFRRMRARGLRVARIWLFENGEGLVLTSRNGGITGLRPDFIANVMRLMQLAEASGVKIYWTLLNGNTARNRGFFAAQYNIHTDSYSEGERFRNLAVIPLAALMAASPSTFGIDILNEVEATIFSGIGKDWATMREFIRRTRDAIKSVAPEVPVTASGGWHVTLATHGLGAFDGLGLDFFDIHIYHFTGRFPGCKAIVAARGAPVLLGEFGPLNGAFGRAGVGHAFESMLRAAADCGMAGALAWRLEDHRFYHSLFTPDGLGWADHARGFLRLVGSSVHAP